MRHKRNVMMGKTSELIAKHTDATGYSRISPVSSVGAVIWKYKEPHFTVKSCPRGLNHQGLCAHSPHKTPLQETKHVETCLLTTFSQACEILGEHCHLRPKLNSLAAVIHTMFGGQNTNTVGGGNIRMWGCFSAPATDTLHITDGRMNRKNVPRHSW